MYYHQALRGRSGSRASVHFILGLAAILVMVLCVLAPRPALAGTGTRQLHLAVTNLQFTSVTCLNDSCSRVRSTIVADASGNLGTGKGSYQATIFVDFSPGGTCDIVDEPHDMFIFDNGTIFVSSHHEDCAVHGLRIDTTFQVTGGTGDFAGASGSGREFGSGGVSAVAPVIFNGTISV